MNWKFNENFLLHKKSEEVQKIIMGENWFLPKRETFPVLVCVFVDVNVYLYVCKRKNDEKQQVVAAKKTSLALTSEQQAKGRHLTIHRERREGIKE